MSIMIVLNDLPEKRKNNRKRKQIEGERERELFIKEIGEHRKIDRKGIKQRETQNEKEREIK